MRYNVAILTEAANSYSQGITTGIANYISEQGNWNISYEERALDSPSPAWLKSWKGDGIIVRSKDPKVALMAVRTGAKVVDLGENRLPGLPTVYPDYAGVANLAAEHFKARQLKRFAYVGIEDRQFSEKRKSAFIKALGASENVHLFDLEQDGISASAFLPDSKLGKWLKSLPKPVGIMTCYDLVGLYVIQACMALEIPVPEEVSVIGVNNDLIQCRMSAIPLTSIAQNTERAGYEAAKLLQSLMEGESQPEKDLIIPPLGIVERQSTDFWAFDDEIVKRALHYIRLNACLGITVQDICESLNISRRLLERRFFRSVNRTVHDEIAIVQMNRAKDLLQNSHMSLVSVAKAVGFSNASHLSLAFKNTFGTTPGKIRRLGMQQYGYEDDGAAADCADNTAELKS